MSTENLNSEMSVGSTETNNIEIEVMELQNLVKKYTYNVSPVNDDSTFDDIIDSNPFVSTQYIDGNKSSDIITSKLYYILSLWTFGQTKKSIHILLLIHCNIFFYAFTYWVLMPILPTLITDINSNEKIYGYYSSIRAFAALFGAPLMGLLIDKTGTKFPIFIGQLFSGFMYFGLGCSHLISNVILLYISGLFACMQHLFLGSQGTISHLTLKRDRDQAMGRLSACYAIGMIPGSLLSGILQNMFGITTTICFMAFISTSVAVLNLLFLPNLKSEMDKNNKTIDADGDGETTEIKGNATITHHCKDVFKVLKNKRVRRFIIFVFLYTFGLGMWASIFNLFMKDYGFNTEQIGVFIAIAAAIMAICNSLFIGPILGLITENTLFIVSVFVCGLSVLIISIITEYFKLQYYELILISIPKVISTGFLYVIVNGKLSKLVELKDVGKSIALSHSMNAFIAIITPIIGVQLASSNIGYSLNGYIAFILCIVSIIVFKIIVK